MSDSSSTITANCKLIEAYTSFLEKICYSSADSDQNLNKLVHLKRNLFQNIQSRTRVENSLNGLFEDKPQPKLEKKHSDSSSSPSPPVKLPQVAHQDPQSPQSPQSPAIEIKPLPVEKIRKGSLFENSEDSSPSTRSSWSQMQETTKLANQIKSSTHPEGQKITSVINSFTLYREFNQSHQSLLSALCLSFFENYLYKLSQTSSSVSDFLTSKLGRKDNDIGTLSEYLNTQFLTFMKTLKSQSLSEVEIKKKIYETLTSDATLYNSCILLFKKIIGVLLEKQGLDTPSKKNSFQWMNELSETDKGLYEELAIFFEANLHFYFLSSIKFVEQTFNYVDQWSYQQSDSSKNRNVYILLDRTNNHSYILYQPKDAYDIPAPSYHSPEYVKKTKPRSYTPMAYREYSLKGEFADVSSRREETNHTFRPSPRSSGRIKKSPREPGQNPLIQISDLLNNTLQVPNSLPYIQRKESAPNYSLDQNFDVVTTLDATSSYSSPIQKQKEYDFSPNHITSREKEKTAPKATEIPYMQSPSSLVDKIMDEINQKIKASKGEKQYSHIPSMSPSHTSHTSSPGKGYHHRAYSDMDNHRLNLNKTPPPQVNYYQANELSPTLKSPGKQVSSFTADLSYLTFASEKQPALPASLKAKFNNFSKTIDQHNFEFGQIISSHVSKDLYKVPASPFLKPYESMIRHKPKGGYLNPSIGSTMR